MKICRVLGDDKKTQTTHVLEETLQTWMKHGLDVKGSQL